MRGFVYPPRVRFGSLEPNFCAVPDGFESSHSVVCAFGGCCGLYRGARDFNAGRLVSAALDENEPRLGGLLSDPSVLRPEQMGGLHTMLRAMGRKGARVLGAERVIFNPEHRFKPWGDVWMDPQPHLMGG